MFETAHITDAYSRAQALQDEAFHAIEAEFSRTRCRSKWLFCKTEYKRRASTGGLNGAAGWPVASGCVAQHGSQGNRIVARAGAEHEVVVHAA